MTSPAASSSSSVAAAPASPLSVKRPALSPRKRKLSDVSSSVAEAASPTSLDEVVGAAGSPLEERVISPKKKARAEERASSGDLSKWESHVVASIASALDLDCTDDKQSSSALCVEPIAFWAAPAGDLAADELQILRQFLA
ncbi:uncharacterized protein IUM83_18044 [Phytophthora cinnamomi]|uniref:uncharacterized protein n=1 Tax=Phytophthora cinnamomi TaxID=4785 RepID=UPI0035597CC0|nr:hypothetical protein IUM83_18046 [Phytophthora cinnamomi]KAG6576158.1 hypothetical protein IUM83_18044 [Phytophthora cinnamomi]